MLKNLVSIDWVSEHLNDEKVRILDCRFQLGKPNAGFEDYQKGHLPNAVYVDLEKDMSGQKEGHGGRHPLPNIDEFISKLESLGIDETLKIITYDDQGGAMASRLWWLLKYVGHKNVYVLNGTYSLWKKEGYPTTTEIPHFKAKKFTKNIQNKMLCFMEDVRAVIADENVMLIDSRDERRYLGIEEPIDKVAGHIPSAKQFFWKDCLKENGEWQNCEQQKARFSSIAHDEEIIVYCGSGVTACPNVLALNSLGYENVKLYLGSWSDWVSYDDNPIETKN